MTHIAADPVFHHIWTDDTIDLASLRRVRKNLESEKLVGRWVFMYLTPDLAATVRQSPFFTPVRDYPEFIVPEPDEYGAIEAFRFVREATCQSNA